METLEIFKEFLIEYNIFDKFIKQATQGKRNPLYSNNISACQLIDMAFLWSWSKEGEDFWNTFDTLWRGECNAKHILRTPCNIDDVINYLQNDNDLWED